MGMVFIYQKDYSLIDIETELSISIPGINIYRPQFLRTAKLRLQKNTPEVVLVDESAQDALELVRYIKSSPALSLIHIVYFLTHEEDLDGIRSDIGSNGLFNQVFVKGSYHPSEVVGSIEDFLQ